MRAYQQIEAVVWKEEEWGDGSAVMMCQKWCWNKWTAERLNGDGEGVFPSFCAAVRGMGACSDTVVC
jgi:hypothetical protein